MKLINFHSLRSSTRILINKGLNGPNQYHILQCHIGRRCCSSQSAQSTVLDFNDSKVPAFYDIVIAGGGLIGTTLAVSLARSKRLADRKILILESMPKPKDIIEEVKSQFSNRVFSINPGSQKILEDLGIWKHIWRSHKVSSLEVWDALSDSRISFKNPGFESPVSYIVENSLISSAILQILEKESNIEIKYATKLKDCTVPKNSDAFASLTLEDNSIVETSLLVGADGFNSKVRSAINSPCVNFNYDRTAIVATLELTELGDNNAAWQRFLPSGGPIALLPLSNTQSSLVWSTMPDNAKNLLKMTPDEFIDSVNSAFWRDYPRSKLVKKSCELLSVLKINRGNRIYPPSVSNVVEGSRASFPLGFSHSSYYVSHRVALIGDAAHRLHPLAGQGLNLGFGDILSLKETLDKAASVGGDIGDLLYLQEYESDRQRKNVAVQGAIDFLHRLYSYEISPIVAIRSFGLSLVNSSDTFKRFIMSQAAV